MTIEGGIVSTRKRIASCLVILFYAAPMTSFAFAEEETKQKASKDTKVGNILHPYNCGDDC
jgi:hypothetical protein